MTLREDLQKILAMTRSGRDGALLERDEHERYQLYVDALSIVSPENERDLITTILRDPDQAMKMAAVVNHVDTRAASLPSAEQVAKWASKILDLVSEYSFTVRRIEEWILFKKISENDVSELDTLHDASDWLQRKVVEESTNQAALELLAEAGRTKRVRNMAKQHLSRFKRR